MKALFVALSFLFCLGAEGQTISPGFWRSAAAAPTVDYDFLSLGSVPAGLIFSRASTAFYHNSAGILTNASAGTARFDYDPTTLGARGLLMEPAATNLNKYSQLIDPPSSGYDYYAVKSVITINSATAPDGTNTATKLAEGSGGGTDQHIVGKGIPGLTTNTIYTLSMYAKAGTLSGAEIFLQDFGGNYDGVGFELTGAGSVKRAGNNGQITSKSVQALPNGWYRLLMTFNSGTGGGGPNYIVRTYDTINDTSYYDAGAGGKFIYLWGIQVELGATASSYIPTLASTATRAADQLVFSSLNWYDPSVGTLFAQYLNGGSQGGANARIFGLFGSNAAGTFAQNEVSLADNASLNASGVSAGGVAQFSASGAVAAAGSLNKLALAYADGNFASSANGSTATEAYTGSLPASAAYAYLGSQPDGNSRVRWLQKIKYFRARMSGPLLKILTQ